MDPEPLADEPSPVQARRDALVDQAVRLLGHGEAAVNWVAARQHSIIGSAQVERCGVGRTARANRCARGTWQRLSRGVYLVGTGPPGDVARVLASTFEAGPCAVATSATGAFLDGLTGRLTSPIELAMIGRRNATAPPGVRIRRPRRLTWGHVRFRSGVPLTCTAETLLALAADLGADEVEACAALALRRGLVAPDELRRAVDAASGRQGVATLRDALRAPLVTRSRNERRMLALVRRAELPEPETNVVVGGKELDLYWPGARLGVEVDAFSTHGSPRSFEDDRAVDADLGAAGLQVLRFTDRRIRAHPEAVVARLAATLALRLGGLPLPGRRRLAYRSGSAVI